MPATKDQPAATEAPPAAPLPPARVVPQSLRVAHLPVGTTAGLRRFKAVGIDQGARRVTRYVVAGAADLAGVRAAFRASTGADAESVLVLPD